MIVPGGRTAYLGPTKYARPYFESLGFQFKVGANESDILMDILSGKGINDSIISSDDLVAQWEKQKLGRIHITPQETSQEEQPQNVEFHQQVGDLVNNRGALIWKQIWFCHQRSLLQQISLSSAFILEIFVGSMAGLLMGVAVAGSGELYRGVFKTPLTIISPAPLEWLIPQY